MDYRRKVPTYTDEDKANFCELAKEIGVNRAIRELGYPTGPTGVAWLRQRGIEPNINETMAQLRAYHTFYKVEDILVTMDNAIIVAEEMLGTCETADDMKKLADALYKIVQTRQLLEGKATQISEKRETTQTDLEIISLINAEKAKNVQAQAQIEEPNKK